MRVFARVLAILIALPLLMGGFSGLRFHLNSEEWRVEERRRLLETYPPGERRERMKPVLELLTVKLEPIGKNRTRLHFEERYNLVQIPWKWFEGIIYRFINRKNEESMRRVSEWLSAHPEYRADLIETE